MLGCSSEAARRASDLKRAAAVESRVYSGAMIFSATIAAEQGIARLVDEAHPAAIEQALDPVAGELGPGGEVRHRAAEAGLRHARPPARCVYG